MRARVERSERVGSGLRRHGAGGRRGSNDRRVRCSRLRMGLPLAIIPAPALLDGGGGVCGKRNPQLPGKSGGLRFYVCYLLSRTIFILASTNLNCITVSMIFSTGMTTPIPE